MSIALPFLAMLVALVLDRVFGEPPAWCHPVVAMGRYLGAIGPRLAALQPAAAFVGGMLAWLAGALLTLLAAWWIESAASVLAWPLAAVIIGVMLKPLLAWRMLRDEVAAVEDALGESLEAGRAQLKRLVSRDVSTLDDVQVRESAIESLAENLNDSLVAPLVWFAIAGLGGAALYRFANTADAMWGYRGRYEWAGKWAAKVDDGLSWLPARLTALLLCAAAGRWPSWSAMRHEARITPSPNGGWPMGTLALLLGVCLGKPGVYLLNAAAARAEPRHTRLALKWAERVVGFSAFIAVLLMTAVTAVVERVA